MKIHDQARDQPGPDLLNTPGKRTAPFGRWILQDLLGNPLSSAK